jgi:DNA-binding transcriptional regulator YiaG
MKETPELKKILDKARVNVSYLERKGRLDQQEFANYVTSKATLHDWEIAQLQDRVAALEAKLGTDHNGAGTS